MPGGAPLEEVPLEQLASPEGALLEAPPARASPLQQRGYSRLHVTPAVTRAGATSAPSLVRRKVSNHSSSAYLTAIATDGALSEFLELGLYTTVALLDIAQDTYGAESAVKYAYATTNVQSCSVGEKFEVIANTSKQAIALPAKLEWKATSEKEVAILKTNNVCTLLTATSAPTRYKIIGSRWGTRPRPTTSARDGPLCWGGGIFRVSTAAARSPPTADSRASAWYWRSRWTTSWSAGNSTTTMRFLKSNVMEEVYVKMAPS